METADGRYVLTYTSYDGKTARLCIATSTDLVTWTKHGPAFARAGGGRYRDLWSKSGAIVCEPRAAVPSQRESTSATGCTGATPTSSGLVRQPRGLDAARAGAGCRGAGSANLSLRAAPPPLRQRPRRAGAAADGDGARHPAPLQQRKPAGGRRSLTARDGVFRRPGPVRPGDPGALIGRTTAPFLSVRTPHETSGRSGTCASSRAWCASTGGGCCITAWAIHGSALRPRSETFVRLRVCSRSGCSQPREETREM